MRCLVCNIVFCINFCIQLVPDLLFEGTAAATSKCCSYALPGICIQYHNQNEYNFSACNPNKYVLYRILPSVILKHNIMPATRSSHTLVL